MIEPNPEVVINGKYHLKNFKSKNLKYYNYCFTNKNQKRLNFYIPDGLYSNHSGQGSIINYNKIYKPERNGIRNYTGRTIRSQFKKIKVKNIKGDTFVKRKKIKKLDFIKIDCEGSDYEVFKGLNKTIKKYRPIVYMEFFKKEQIYLKKILLFANSNNYSLFNCAKNKLKKIKYLHKNYSSHFYLISNSK